MRAYDALHARNRLAQTIATLGASRKSKSTTKIVKVHALLMHVVCTAIAVCPFVKPVVVAVLPCFGVIVRCLGLCRHGKNI